MCKIEKFQVLVGQYRELVVNKVLMESQLQEVYAAEQLKLEEMRRTLASIKEIKTKQYLRERIKDLNQKECLT